MKLHIQHATTFRYSLPLLYTLQTLRLWPVSGPTQTVESWDLRVPGNLQREPDVEGNRAHSFSVVFKPAQGVQQLVLHARGVVQTHGTHEFSSEDEALPAAFYLRPSPWAEPHPRMALWALKAVPALLDKLAHGAPPSVTDLLDLCRALVDKVRHRQQAGAAESTALEAFDWELGDSQEQVQVMVAVCRSIGLPARFVSGWLCADPSGLATSHAWVEICVDEARHHWVSLDVTHALPTDERHVRLAAAVDGAACQPVRGARHGGGAESVVSTTRVKRV